MKIIIYIGNTQQTFKKRMDGHFSDVLRLLNNGQKSDSFAAHFEQHVESTTSRTDLRKCMTFKVVKQLNPIGAMKTFTKPTCNLSLSRYFLINILTFELFVRLSTIVQLGKPPGSVDSGTNFERSSSQNMWTRLNFERNIWTRLTFRLKHVDSIKFSVFLPPQSDFCISTAIFCLPSQI